MNRIRLFFICCLVVLLKSCSNGVVDKKDLELLKKISSSDSISVEKDDDTYILNIYANSRSRNTNWVLSASKIATAYYQIIYESSQNMSYNSNFEITYFDSDKIVFSKTFDLVYLSNVLVFKTLVEEVVEQMGMEGGQLDSQYLYPLECKEDDAIFDMTGINWGTLVLSDISFAGIYPVEANLCDSNEEVDIYCYVINKTSQMLWFYMKDYQDSPKVVAIVIPEEGNR